ncbi:MAG: hypothetical protein ACQES9_08790 [Myxococcota bacterium]
MKCQKCKTEIKGKLKFCPQCGAPVKAKPKKTLFWTPGNEKKPDFKKKSKTPGNSKPFPPPPSSSPSSSSLPSPPSPGVPDSSAVQSNSGPVDSSFPLDMNNLNFSKPSSNSYQGNASPPNQVSQPQGTINFKNNPAPDNSRKKIVYIVIGIIWLLAIAELLYYFLK